MSKLNLLPSPLNLNATYLRSLPRRKVRPLFFPTAVILCILVLIYLGTALTPTHTHPVEHSEFENVTENSSKKPPRILLVSALFPLTHAKHTHEEYISWLRNFLGPDGVQSDVYFYTTPELASLVSSLHSSTTQRITINTTYTSPFSIPPLSPYTSAYHLMHAWDRERAIHSPELYAVWNAKPWLLEHALLSESFSRQEYDYAFWVDAGSFRAPHPFRRWPDPRRVEEVFARGRGTEDRDHKVLIPLYGVPGLKEYAWRFEMGPVDTDLSEGSFFGSTPHGISWFSKAFYDTHDWYIRTSPPPHDKTPASFHFVGKDQTLMNTLLFRYPERFIGMLEPSRAGLLPPPSNSPPSKPYILTLPSLLTRLSHSLFHRKSSCGDWFFYQWFLASEREREYARGMGWSGCPNTGKVRGREKTVVDVERMLRGLFGGRWVEGRRAGGA